LRVFAGPNGSGKSTIESLVSSKYNIGKFVNADLIEQALRHNKRLSLGSYSITLKPGELAQALKSSGFRQKQDINKLQKELSLRSNILTLKQTDISYSYL